MSPVCVCDVFSRRVRLLLCLLRASYATPEKQARLYANSEASIVGPWEEPSPMNSRDMTCVA